MLWIVFQELFVYARDTFSFAVKTYVYICVYSTLWPPGTHIQLNNAKRAFAHNFFIQSVAFCAVMSRSPESV
jgi:hypothetical protein